MKRRAPGPKGSLIWGSLSEFRRDTLELLSNAARDYGDIVRLRFGPVTAHLINHPDYIEQVLSRDAQSYDKDTRSAAKIRATCGDSLLSANQQAWKRHRALIQPVFQPKNFVNIDATIDAEMTPLIDRWHRIAAEGGCVDIVTEITHLTIAISAKILFTSDVDAARLEAALAILLDDTWRRLEALFDPSMIADALHRPAFKKARAEIEEIIFRIIETRRAGSDWPDDLLSRLLRAHEAEGEAKLTDQELRDATLTLLLAGHETTANALCWALYFLGQYPDLNPDRVGTDNFLAETFRLYPSIWIIERRAITAQEIGGCYIPKGSSVLISPYILHRQPQFWPRPESFDPTRFTEDNPSTRPRHAYIPFGLGPHRCVGLYLAKAIAGGVVTRLNNHFRLSPEPDQVPQIFPGITLRHKVDFKMRIDTISP